MSGDDKRKRIPALFFRTESGGRTGSGVVKGSAEEGSERIGEDIKTVEMGWPLGMPICRTMGQGLFEVSTDLDRNRIARVLFYIDKKGRMVLLHGFEKKTQRLPLPIWNSRDRTKSKHKRGLE